MRSVIPFFTGNNNMQVNPLIVRWSAIVLAILAPLIYAGYLSSQRDNFSCGAHLIIVDNDVVLDLISNYTFNNGRGSYESFGQYKKGSEPPVGVSNKVSFDYWREASKFVMVSNETNQLPKREKSLLAGIPDFYRLRDRGIRMRTVRASAASDIFLYGQAPFFYCRRPGQGGAALSSAIFSGA